MSEAAEGALIVDYQPDTFSIVGADPVTAMRGRNRGREEEEEKERVGGERGEREGREGGDMYCVGSNGCIDYSRSGRGARVGRLIDMVEGQVSWGESQKLYIYQLETL